jgi:hypothetical protein
VNERTQSAAEIEYQDDPANSGVPASERDSVAQSWHDRELAMTMVRSLAGELSHARQRIDLLGVANESLRRALRAEREETQRLMQAKPSAVAAVANPADVTGGTAKVLPANAYRPERQVIGPWWP